MPGIRNIRQFKTKGTHTKFLIAKIYWDPNIPQSAIDDIFELINDWFKKYTIPHIVKHDQVGDMITFKSKADAMHFKLVFSEYLNDW